MSGDTGDTGDTGSTGGTRGQTAEAPPAGDGGAARSVGRAAARLVAQPTHLGAWWELAAALADSGRAAEARTALVELGRSASQLGHVGLAVACTRALAAAGESKAAAELVRRVAKAHGRGSKKIDRAIRSAPPAPPPVDPTVPGASIEPPADLDEAVKLADKAIQGAAASAKSRAPDSLAPTPLISVLEPDEVRELCGVMELDSCAAGDVVLDVGQPAEALYWIARGQVAVSRGDHHLGELHGNQFFGEIALVSGTTRTARVTAVRPTLLLRIPAEAVEKLAARAPRLGRVLAVHARARLLAGVMRTSELFSRLGEDERSELLPLFDTELFEAGDVLVKHGEHSERLFVVASGRCAVRDGDDVLTELGVGDGVGEMSLLARRPATFDVVALERTVCLTLVRDKFDEVAVNHPGLLAEVYKLLVQREAENRGLVHDATDLVV